MATFSATDILKRFVSWNTMLMCFIKSAWSSFRTSTPPTVTEPSLTSQNRAMRLHSVVFPEPLGPVMAVKLPWVMEKDTPSTAFTASSPWP